MVVFLVGLPPILAAFRVIDNSQRVLVFIVSWLLPLPLLFVMLFGNQFLFGANGDEIRGILLLGLPLIVFITDFIASVLLLAFGIHYLYPQGET